MANTKKGMGPEVISSVLVVIIAIAAAVLSIRSDTPVPEAPDVPPAARSAADNLAGYFT